MQAIFQLVQTIYWAGLATWFGSAMFLAISAPVIFRVVRESDPTLPTVLSVNLDHQHSTLLGSTIVGRLMQTVTRVGLGCALLVFVGLVTQGVILQPPSGSATLVQFVIRTSLFFLASSLLVYDWRVISPRLFHSRQEYVDHADDPDVANAAKDTFDRIARESLNVLFLEILLLLGLILFSSNVVFVFA